MILIPVPTQVKVGAHTYQITVEESDDLKDSRSYAQVNHRLQTIQINKLRADSECSEALLHELLHIIISKYIEGDFSEHTISLLSEGLAQALQSVGVDFDWQEAKGKGG